MTQLLLYGIVMAALTSCILASKQVLLQNWSIWDHGKVSQSQPSQEVKVRGTIHKFYRTKDAKYSLVFTQYTWSACFSRVI